MSFQFVLILMSLLVSGGIWGQESLEIYKGNIQKTARVCEIGINRGLDNQSSYVNIKFDNRVIEWKNTIEEQLYLDITPLIENEDLDSKEESEIKLISGWCHLS